MTDEWIEALGGVETYRRRYRIFHGTLFFVGMLLPAFILASLRYGRDTGILARSWAPWLAGLLVMVFVIAALFGWFVPGPDELADGDGSTPREDS